MAGTKIKKIKVEKEKKISELIKLFEREGKVIKIEDMLGLLD